MVHQLANVSLLTVDMWLYCQLSSSVHQLLVVGGAEGEVAPSVNQ